MVGKHVCDDIYDIIRVTACRAWCMREAGHVYDGLDPMFGGFVRLLVVLVEPGRHLRATLNLRVRRYLG